MRSLSLIYTLFILFSPSAFAVKDLFTLCERSLTVDQENILQLMPNQIAFRGQLNHYWETGMEDQMGWLIDDEFLRRKVTPNPMEFSHWLQEGDRLFILDEAGKVAASGYFSQKREHRVTETTEGAREGHPNLPRLFSDREMTELSVDYEQLTALFFTNAHAVVIHTQTAEQTEALQKTLKPWFARYEVNKTQVERFVRIARRRAYEQAHFETVHHGSLIAEGKTGRARNFDFDSGEFVPGDTYRAVKYFLLEGETRSELRPGERIFLLDKKGLVLLEGTVGSPEFPLASAGLEKMEALETKIRQSRSAAVVRYQFRKLKN